MRKAPIVAEYVTLLPCDIDVKEGIMYVSEEFEIGVHKCMCGCGNLTFTPFGKDGWNLIEDKGWITITPSIGNYQFKCKSHYVITNGIANWV